MTASVLSEGPGSLDAGSVDAWRALAEARENPFLTPEWCEAWLGIHPGEQPFIVLWHQAGKLRGVLPLVVSRAGGARELRFLGARRGDWFTPACAEADEVEMAGEVAALLKRERRTWSLLRLDRVDSASAWPQALWEAGEGLAPARWRRQDVLPYIEFGPDGYEGYLAARSRNFRSQLGRRRRKIEAEHELGFRMTADLAQFDADFTTFFRLHEERWQERGGSSSAEQDVQSFQRAFAGAALERGWLRLWTAEVDGEPAASWYGWRVGDRYCYSLSGLSKQWESAALGTVLLAHTIEQAAAEGARIYDLMWGDEGYKARFETGRREAATWVVGRRRSPVQLAAATRTGLERKARAARERKAKAGDD